MNTPRSGTLDGVRGVAILLVLFGHLAQNYGPLEESTRRWLMAYANAGAGVRLFFVLSGYLITHLLIGEHVANGTIDLRRFYWRRAVRIFPAFYVYLFGLAVLAFLLPLDLAPAAFVTAASFTWNYSFLWLDLSAPAVWHLGHLWTLALEQQFYLVWPATLLLSGLRHAPVVAIGLAIWCPLARLVTYAFFPAQRGHLDAMLHTAIDPLMVGCAAALVLRAPVWRDRFRQRGHLGLISGTLWLFGLSPALGQWISGFPAAAGLTLDAVSAAWIIAWVHLEPSPPLQRLLGHGILPMLGTISFSLYLWQQVFLSASGPLGRGEIFVPLTCSILCATASYRWVERPALALKSYGTRSAATTTTT